jgi:hypothetical protein
LFAVDRRDGIWLTADRNTPACCRHCRAALRCLTNYRPTRQTRLPRRRFDVAPVSSPSNSLAVCQIYFAINIP